MTFRGQVLSGIRWTAGARFSAQLGTWAITLIVIRILSPSDYGLLAMATMFITFVSIFGELGLGSAIVQREEIDTPTLQAIFGIVLVVHFALAVLLIACASLISEFFSEPRLIPVLQVLSLQFLLAAFVVIPDAVLQRRMKFKGRSLVDLVAVLIGSTSTLLLALGGWGVWALVTGTLVMQVIKTVGLNILMPFGLWPTLSLRGTRPLLRFGGELTLTQILWVAFTQSDALICGRLLGKEALGIYSVALHLASLPIQRIAGIVNQVAFPAFARLQGNLEQTATAVWSGVSVLSFAAFPVLWGISSIAPEIVDIVLGPKWQPAALPLQILGIIMPLRVVGYFLPNAIQGVGRSDILLRNSLWALVIVLPLLFVGASRWGVFGLCLAWLVASPLLFLQSMHRTLPVLGMRLGHLMTAIAPAAVAGVLMYVAVFCAREIVSDESSGAVRLLVLIVVGAVTYAAASWWFNRQGVERFIDLVRALAARNPPDRDRA